MSTLIAQELVPLAAKRNREWRALMSPEEMAAFDQGEYDHPATTPRESFRISRDKRLVRLSALNDHDVVGRTNPEQTRQVAEYLKALAVIASLPRPCVTCGQNPPEGSRFAILRYDSDYIPEGFMHCCECFKALRVSLEPNNWFSQLPVLDKKIWRLLNDGLTQPQIAARLTNGNRRVTQQMVSDAKQKIARRITESRQNKYGSRLQ
jgi:hypothetical protein